MIGAKRFSVTKNGVKLDDIIAFDDKKRKANPQRLAERLYGEGKYYFEELDFESGKPQGEW